MFKVFHLTDGRVLRTLDDAARMIHSLTVLEQGNQKWARAAGMVKVAIQTGREDHVLLATSQIEQALSLSPFGSVLLAHQQKPPRASSRRRMPNERKRRA